MLSSEVKGQHGIVHRTPEPPGEVECLQSGCWLIALNFASQANHLTFRCREALKLPPSQLTLTSDSGDLSRPFCWHFQTISGC